MTTVMPVLLNTSPARAGEEDKITSFLMKAGFDRSTASRYAKVARKNGWTEAILYRIMSSLRDEQHLKSKGIELSMAVSPNEYGSPITVRRAGRKEYKVTLFLGDPMKFSEENIDAAMRHELRHVYVIAYLEELSQRDKDASLYGIINKEGFRMFGSTADDVYNKLFSRLDKMDLMADKVRGKDIALFLYKLVDEIVVWANATRPELSESLFRNIVNVGDIEGRDRYDEAKLIMGFAEYKLIADKHHLQIKDSKYAKVIDKYKDNPLFKDTYAFLGLCFDVSRAYFPK